MHRFSSVLEHLAHMLQLPELPIDEDGSCSLLLDETMLTFRYEAETELFLVYSPIGMLPEQDTAARAAELLAANAFYSGTAGFTLALHGSLALLQAALPVSALDAALLFKTVERFVHTREYWAERLAAPAQNGLETDATPTALDMRSLV